jgi:hypothetical protein
MGRLPAAVSALSRRTMPFKGSNPNIEEMSRMIEPVSYCV